MGNPSLLREASICEVLTLLDPGNTNLASRTRTARPATDPIIQNQAHIKPLQEMPRPALLPVDHPLAYSYVKPADRLHRAQPYSIEDKVHFLFERQNITDLLNNYAYKLDVFMVDSSAADRWAALFTDDCVITYPFGTHVGTKGLADWCLNAELRFHRMMASVSPFQMPAALDNGFSTSFPVQFPYWVNSNKELLASLV